MNASILVVGSRDSSQRDSYNSYTCTWGRHLSYGLGHGVLLDDGSPRLPFTNS